MGITSREERKREKNLTGNIYSNYYLIKKNQVGRSNLED